MKGGVVSTNLARCRDCYRCVRNCSVKAVRVQNGQAQVVPELCIACGTCVRACPQRAKSVRDDRPAVQEALAAGRTVVASVAPSAPAYFDMRSFTQIEDVLTRLGFKAAGETAYGAEMVGLIHKELVEQEPARWPIITSACPVVVGLIEKYYPDLIPHLSPIISPMIAHGRWLHERYGQDAFVVFIGPCIAKKAEQAEPPVAGAVDAALTFEELQEWMDAESVRLLPAAPALLALPASTASTGSATASAAELAEAGEAVPRVNARVFPIEGGLIGTAELSTDLLDGDVVTTSGLGACQDVLRSIRSGQLKAKIVDLLACGGGCINGPAMEGRGSVTLARQRILEYASRRQPQPLPTRDEWPALSRDYSDKSTPVPTFSEEQIRQVLRLVDKFTPEDELNCGACGYASCRDKAAATLRGMAEATMCIPYMRRRAESLRQVVMDVTPNAIVVVDTRLKIQDISPSAEQMFKVRLASVVGQPLQTLMPVVDGFAHVRDTGKFILSENARLRDDLIVEQTIVPVQGQNLLVGILRDVTERERQHEQLEHIRSETLKRTQEVVQNQMRVAHEIAQLLGETTAETKMMLSRLARLLEEGNGK